ncbi:beta-N-acetylhexosaminidase [Actinacidiphila sp. DG2A-62]|uniref:beta-N-acetylhexosaminidase n=1 Tax=Actinacidiphila sp. DG2A-62 TaxID=3108821 RepID=UPI002DBCC4D5|nr:beta-N-acetylhexosaminidase [Actinacidiphila sp. DG2A-62]MEC3994326.1 beta-N-acetylhexosaminidase [Actinacidiphila sp. DG2A-62]
MRGALPRVLCALLLASGATAAGARAASSPPGSAPGAASGAATASGSASGSGSAASRAAAAEVDARVIPVPAAVQAGGGAFRITSGTRIEVDGGADAPDAGSPEAHAVADYAAALLRPATGYPLPVEQSRTADGEGGRDADPAGIVLALDSADPGLGDEGYRLRTTAQAVTVTARTPAGLFHGVQTLRQLLPAAVESHDAVSGVAWTVPDADIRDVPRYAYRGAMLDSARHFLTVAQVERAIDQYALYKINTLHLHLTDDQGWRIAIDSWPRLASYGGSTQVGGGSGGYYTQADYREIVRYAASRFLTVVPEIDGPGHSNAALASYAELNCDGKAPALYTGTAVGFSSFCAPKEVTYTFLDDVVREIAALTPGPYVHIGGDEAQSTSAADYATYTDRAQQIVAAHGKTAVGWHQIDSAHPAPGALAQYWGTAGNEADVAKAAQAGTGLIMSPANRSYLDMQYDASTPVGKHWAGYVDVRTSYDWDPATFVQGVPAGAVRGVEAALWTETLQANKDMDYMTFPRLPGIAEIGWSPQATHDWDAYRVRLAAQGPRWAAMGIDYYRSPQVDWPAS